MFRQLAKHLSEHQQGASRVLVLSLLILALLTAALAGLQRFINVETVTIIYLIAVLFAATRGGVFPAIVTAFAAIGAAAFFFYAPIYDFRVYNPVHLVDLVLFIIVAVVTGKLATDARRAKMREQADALRDALIGSVSHELRSPLASIVGSASILAKAPEVGGSPRVLSLVQGLQEEAERLNDQIQNLLNSTLITSEGVRPHTEWADAGDIVNSAIDRKRRLLAAHKLEVAVDKDLPLVHVDPLLVERALGHLIENAAKYSPPASLIQVRAEQSEGGLVRLAVKDSGVGLAGDERIRIWERHYRGARHRHMPGSGLGLWIAQALVTACKGRVEAVSAGVGLGATVSLYLPAAASTVPVELDEAE